MRAMVLTAPGRPLELVTRTRPFPSGPALRVRVEACGVCRTDLHVADGELPDAKRPVVLGHQVVGVVDAIGDDVTGVRVGERVGVPWLGATCGGCRFCTTARENLCEAARFTGYQIDGGFADFMIADGRYVFPIPADHDPVEAAPLLCAGLIGYRALAMAGAAEHLGLYGFGASAHIVAQVARHRGQAVFAFTRPGDRAGQAFARSLGAVWTGSAEDRPPRPLDAAIIFAPAGELVPAALASVDRGGTVVCAGIHMSDIPSFPYARLWGERTLRSVANLTRRDGEEFFTLASTVPITTRVTAYALPEAQRALDDLRHGRFEGAAVVVP